MAWFITDAPWDAKEAPDDDTLFEAGGWRRVTEKEAREHQAAVDAYRGVVGKHPLSVR